MPSRDKFALRLALASHVPARGKRYAHDLKARVTEFARARRSQGASWDAISSDLGLNAETLRRWSAGVSPPRSRAMVPVQIVEAVQARSLSVVSPTGYRVDGVTIEEAASLLRLLG